MIVAIINILLIIYLFYIINITYDECYENPERSNSYCMGRFVGIFFTKGINKNQVKETIKKFKQGLFNEKEN